MIDAYTKRIFQRHGWVSKAKGKGQKAKRPDVKLDGFSYDELKLLCESALNKKSGTARRSAAKAAAARLDYWQDYHAQLVMVGKHFCRTHAPRCDECPLKPLLPRLK